MRAEQIQPEKAPVMARLLAALVGAVARRPRVVLGVSLLVAGLSVYAFCTRLTYRTQRDDLVSQKKESQQRWKRYLAEFGDDDDMVVVVRGADRARMKESLEALACRISERPECFDRLFYKVGLR